MAGADPNTLVRDCDIICSNRDEDRQGDMSLLSVHSSLGHADMVSLLLEWGAELRDVGDSGISFKGSLNFGFRLLI